MAIFLGTMTTGAFSVVIDRFLGVHESYLVTPLSKKDMALGIIFSGMLITTVLAFLVLLISLLITGFSLEGGISSLPLLLSVILLTSLGLLGMTFILLGRANHLRVVGIVGGFLNVILFFPSGAIYPIDSFPGWLKALARINPETYAVSALKSILFKGANLDAIKGDILFLLFFTVAMLILATFSYKRTL